MLGKLRSAAQQIKAHFKGKARLAHMAALERYQKQFDTLTSGMQARFQAPIGTAAAEAMTDEELANVRAKLAASDIFDLRVQDEQKLREEFEKKDAVLALQVTGPADAVVTHVAVARIAVSAVHAKLYLIAKIASAWHIFDTAVSINAIGPIILRNPGFVKNEGYTDRRLRQRNIGRLGPYDRMPIDSDDARANLHVLGTAQELDLSNAASYIAQHLKKSSHSTAKRLYAEGKSQGLFE